MDVGMLALNDDVVEDKRLDSDSHCHRQELLFWVRTTPPNPRWVNLVPPYAPEHEECGAIFVMHGNIPKNNGTESLSHGRKADNQNCDLLYQATLLLPLNDVSSRLPEGNCLIGQTASNELPLRGLRVCGRREFSFLASPNTDKRGSFYWPNHWMGLAIRTRMDPTGVG